MDVQLRNLERRWKESNSDEDFLAYYRHYLRSGGRLTLFQWGAWIGVACRRRMEISLSRQYFRTLESEIVVHLHNVRPSVRIHEPVTRSGHWQARRTNVIISRTSEPVQKLEMPLVIYGYVPATARQAAHPTQQAAEMPDVGAGCMRFFSDGTYDYRSGGVENNFASREPIEFGCGIGVLNFITDVAEAALPPPHEFPQGVPGEYWLGY